jgi:Protein of unknown function (DUF3300)
MELKGIGFAARWDMQIDVSWWWGRTLGRLVFFGLVAWAGTALWGGSPVLAQEDAPAQEAVMPALLGPDELRRVVAPVAFYPDDLLAIVLPAATNPLQIVEAQRFLQKRQKDQKLQADNEWDPAILALLNYSEVLEKMNADLAWTQALGNAVIDQLEDVMDMIQQLRAEAAGSGYLQTNVMQVVYWEDDYWYIDSSDPDYIFIPDYPPDHPIYNPGLRPEHPIALPPGTQPRPEHPIAYPPPPYVTHYPYWSPGAVFFAGAILGSAFGYGLDWGGSDININVGADCCRGGNINAGRGDRVDHRMSDRFGADKQWVNGRDKMTWSADKARQRQAANAKSASRDRAGTLPAKKQGAGVAAKQKGVKLVNPADKHKLSGDKSLRGERKSTLGNYQSSREVNRDRNRGRDSMRDSRANRIESTSGSDRVRLRTTGASGAFGGFSQGSSARMNSNRGSRSMGSRGGRR